MRKVIIDTSIEEKIVNLQLSHDFNKEVGGILAGLFDTHELCLKITDMSFPYPSDIKSRFLFYRRNQGHQDDMDRIWEQSNYVKSYLGEWHTHDQSTPYPSLIDERNWLRLNNQNTNFDQSCFIIIGRSSYGLWVVNDKGIQKQEVIL